MKRVAAARPSSFARGSVLLATASVTLLAACTGPSGTSASPSPTEASASPSAATTTPVPTAAASTPSATVVPIPDADATTAPAEPDAPEAPPTAAGASPVLASATLVDGKVELTGFVQGPIVAGGECRFELLAGSTVVRASSTSEADATSTLCPGVAVDAPGGDPARWTARLVWVPTGATSPAVAVVVA